MFRNNLLKDGIPISVSLDATLESENIRPKGLQSKKRLITIAALATGIAICVSFIARLLVSFIDLITNISFHGTFSLQHASPATNTLGWLVIVIPVIGGLIVGLMALYGSRAIRGHGIPEAMEQILTNQSKIKPSITYLKPVSSAIAIGTGGPFGAEGPIIATGGALGSTVGQLLRITHNERKILLASGATAGMAAIFGSPIAGIFLAIELLLFEFSPRSILPVALACITGAAGHHFLFEPGPVFPVGTFIQTPSNMALFAYCVIGICMGLLSVLITKIVYFIEDVFEKLPVHWMWWPAIGGLVVGIVGYYAPHTLGVGYENITNILSGTTPVKILLSLCVLKFVSWAVALGSGTSGGTLAPLLTIGGAAGALAGSYVIYLFPGSGIVIPVAALVGMSAMFAGASRALLTSIIFAIEVTGQSNALLPLLAACTAAYFVSYLLMENTIMTEKITRRGVKTPDSYEPDLLEKILVKDVLKENEIVISEENTIGEACRWLESENDHTNNYFTIVSKDNHFMGIVSSSSLFSSHHNKERPISSLIKRNNISINMNDSLRLAVETMARENIDMLPVVSTEKNMLGIVSYKEIISAYKHTLDEHVKKHPGISLKRNGLKILVRGQKLINTGKRKFLNKS